jgi:hypothetical protein
MAWWPAGIHIGRNPDFEAREPDEYLPGVVTL